MAIIRSSSVGITHAETGLVRGRDARATRSVRSGIEANSEPLGAAADTFPDFGCVLTDAGGEHQGVDAAEHRSQRAQVAW